LCKSNVYTKLHKNNYVYLIGANTTNEAVLRNLRAGIVNAVFVVGFVIGNLLATSREHWSFSDD